MDIKDFVTLSQDSEFKKVKVIYDNELVRIKEFYSSRLKANINSFGIKESLSKKNGERLFELSQPRWEILRKENPYLNSLSFFDDSGKLLTYLGKKPKLKPTYYTKQELYDGFMLFDDEFSYFIVLHVKNSAKKNLGFIAFSINAKYFLSQLTKLFDIHAYIITQDRDKNLYFSLEKDKEILKKLEDKNIVDMQEIEIEQRFFTSFVIHKQNMPNSFSIVFLQDTTFLKVIVKKAILQSLLIFSALAILMILIINYGFEVILKELDWSNKRLKNSQENLKKLNQNLQEEVDRQIQLQIKKDQEAKEKERILSHQSKLASMGEMIGNIAHQWRQPLTALATILINIELFFQKDKLTKERLESKIVEANEQISYMSKTIDDFRDFFGSKKELQNEQISSIIDSAKNLMSASLKNHNIALHVKIEDDFIVEVFSNEIAQALLNIISNAKDMLVEREIQNAKIFINTFLNDGIKTLTISDNAKGIQIEPIEKIFEPYFTTKHAKSGTGIGLYMAKIIIEKNNNAKIDVKNTQDGALFSIIF